MIIFYVIHTAIFVCERILTMIVCILCRYVYSSGGAGGDVSWERLCEGGLKEEV